MYIWCSVFVCLAVSAGYIGALPTFTPVAQDLAENSAVGTSVVLTGAGGTGPYTFTAVSQTPNLGWFAVSGTASAAGSIAIAADKTVDFENADLVAAGGDYEVVVKIVDTADSAEADVTFTFTITDVNEAPAFSASAFAVQMASPQAAGTALKTCDATDDDGDTITYSIEDTTNFAIDTGTGAVTVKAGVTLTNTFLTTEVYAADDDATPLTTTGYLFVCIGTSCSDSTTCSGATTITGSVMAAISVLVALLMKVA